MKKTFQLKHPKIKAARLLDSARHDIKKYLKRERHKELPDNMDYWDFDCKFGSTIEDAKKIHVAEISQCLNTVAEQELSSFYLEVLARAATRNATTSPASPYPQDDKAQDDAGENRVSED
ncbi:MAG: DUF6172 family protein [Mariprofundus sp.]|nr:DUF6172 family protein [Mariprofundus sp.]